MTTEGQTQAKGVSSRSPELEEVRSLIREGRLKDAETKALLFTGSEMRPAVRLEAFSFLIRIGAETRTIDKIPPYIEEIKKLDIKTPEEKALLAQCLYSTGLGWLYSSNPEKAREYFNRSLAISEEVGAAELVFSNRLMLVDILRTDGSYQQVLDQVDELKTLAEATGVPVNVGKVYSLIGNVHRKLGFYRKALESYESARKIYNDYKSTGQYHFVLWAIGTCYAALEDREKAGIYLDLAKTNAQGGEFWRINVLSDLTMAELYTVLGDFTHADETYKKVSEVAGTDENSYYGRRILRGQTLLAIKRGEFAIANEIIDRLVIVALREKNQNEIMRLRLLKAEVLLREGEAVQHDEARTMLQEVLAYYRDRGARRQQVLSLELIARLDSRSGYPNDAARKIDEMLELAQQGNMTRLLVRGHLARMVLERKFGRETSKDQITKLEELIQAINGTAEKMILQRFSSASYEEWSNHLQRLDIHYQRFVNEFFEDFHFVPQQSIDIEIDRNSNYVREKHLGEIPFHNKFTLMRILCLLAEAPGKEFSKEQLAQEIWGQDYNPLRHDNNIYININRLRKLLEPNPRESRYVMNGARGYYFNPAMKVNISSKISEVAPRAQGSRRTQEGVQP